MFGSRDRLFVNCVFGRGRSDSVISVISVIELASSNQTVVGLYLGSRTLFGIIGVTAVNQFRRLQLRRFVGYLSDRFGRVGATGQQPTSSHQ